MLVGATGFPSKEVHFKQRVSVYPVRLELALLALWLITQNSFKVVAKYFTSVRQEVM